MKKKRKGVSSSGCICTLCWECIFNIFKNVTKITKKKCLAYLDMLHALFQQKLTCFVPCIKKINLMLK
jgi:hypothetical protein